MPAHQECRVCLPFCPLCLFPAMYRLQPLAFTVCVCDILQTKANCNNLHLAASCKSSFRGQNSTLSAIVTAALKHWVWVQPVLLRRTKGSTIDGEPVVKLPPREQQLVRKAFSMSEQRFYDQVQAESMQKLKVCAKSTPGLLLAACCFHCPVGSLLQDGDCCTFAGKPFGLSCR